MRPCPNSRHHGAAERLLECLHQVVPVLRRDVEATSRLGETFHIEDALRAGPTVASQLIADDMNGERSTVRFEELAERAGRAAAGFLAVSHQDDDDSSAVLTLPCVASGVFFHQPPSGGGAVHADFHVAK